MANVTVPALKPLTYQGRSYVRGELVTARAIDALAMSRRREVSLTKGVIIAPEPPPERRDMEAESPGRRRRRNYRRADMQAQSTE